MKWLFGFLLLLSFGCSYAEKHEESEPSAPSDVETLKTRFAEKKAAYELATNGASGWPSVDDCDATLWAGLVCAAGAPVAIELAELEPGVVHRRPERACWTAEAGDVGSKSTVSNDMLLGYLWCGWRAGNLLAMQRLADYGEAHNWVMGEPFPEMASRVVLKPNQIGILGRIIYALSNGDDDRGYRDLPAVYAPGVEDYELHLQTVGILLGGETTELAREQGLLDINGESLKRLEDNAKKYPDDALVQAALGVYTGDFNAATKLLLDPGYEYPTYVRGAELYKDVHWLFAASLVLRRYGNGE